MLAAALLLPAFTVFAQPAASQPLRCGMSAPTADDGTGPRNAAQFASGMIDAHSGAHLPTHGLIRGLVVFVQTKNDEAPSSEWPLGSMPLWAAEYRDRLQRYFSDMSSGELQLSLDVFPDLMVTRSREEEYIEWQQDFGHAAHEILDSLDTRLDFAPYDLWDAEGQPYRVEAGPDGRVDLLIFVFRSIAHTGFLPFSGVSDLGFPGYHFLDGSLARWVYGGTGQFNDASSSGITVCRAPGYRIVTDMDFAFQVTMHEFGHKLFGEGHPAELYGALGIMANAGNGYAMSSFERHLAGYIHYRETMPDVDTTIVLRDYVSTGDAVLIPLARQQRGYYALEFRNRMSEWDSAPLRGLYIYRIYDSWSRNQKYVEVISAEGKFTWALDSASNTVHPVSPSPLSGKSRFQRIPLNGKTYWAEGWWGDPRSAFTLDRPSFAVMKNPSPDFLNGSDTVYTDLRLTLLAMDDSSATVGISYRDPAILSASTPEERGFRLAPPYPNPLAPQGLGTLPFETSRDGHVRIRLYDALGRALRTILDADVRAGAQQLRFSAAGLPAGLYSVVLESAGGQIRQTLLISE